MAIGKGFLYFYHTIKDFTFTNGNLPILKMVNGKNFTITYTLLVNFNNKILTIKLPFSFTKWFTDKIFTDSHL